MELNFGFECYGLMKSTREMVLCLKFSIEEVIRENTLFEVRL